MINFPFTYRGKPYACRENLLALLAQKSLDINSIDNLTHLQSILRRENIIWSKKELEASVRTIRAFMNA